MQNYKLHVTTFSNFIEIQKNSFCWFISEGLIEEFNLFSANVNATQNVLSILGNDYKLKTSEYTDFYCKKRNETYSARIYVRIQLKSLESIILFDKRIFLGVLPLMTDKATFIINGCERVIISQIIRSPGIYFQNVKHKIKNKSIATLISKNGSWLNFELQSNNFDKQQQIYISSDKFNKIKAIDFLNQMSSTKSQISQNFYCNELINLDSIFSEKSNYIYLYFLNKGFLNIGKTGRLQINKSLKININLEIDKITSVDVILILDHLFLINKKKNLEDDIDHLKNKKVKSVGELVQFQFFLGLEHIKQIIIDRFAIQDNSLTLNPNTLINPQILNTIIKQFFGSSQLSQFMDQINPLSALTHKRRISSLGLGGVNKDRVSIAVRDIHPSHYGRICPIETPEGQNAGLIASLTTCARINSFGFIETPFWRVKKGKIFKTNNPFYLTADIEDNFRIAPADTRINESNFILEKIVTIRYKQEFIAVSYLDIDFIAISPVQIVSPAAALIPFFEHDDANRALMGSNMQRQAVPLLISQKSLIGTGLEHQIAVDSCMTIIAINDGIIFSLSSKKIIIVDKFNKKISYNLEKYVKSNQSTCINYHPIVWVGEKVKSGQVIADGSSTKDGELSLGCNVTVAYMSWEGYNYEDAILINERLIYEDIFTSIHIEKYDVEISETLHGSEQTTPNIPSTSLKDLKNLNFEGIIKKGTFVTSNDILVGKITPKDLSNEMPEMKLLKVVFGTNINDVKDTSLRLPKGVSGRVLDVKTITKNNANENELNVGVIKMISIFIAQIRKIRIGDKISGRHGNKGIISKIIPRQDMPYLPDGTPVDIILNPLGVPSRMNVGQLYECLLGYAAHKLNRRFKILPFDEMYGLDYSRILINTKLKEASLKNNEGWLFNPYSPGKFVLMDGRTNQVFNNPITVGKSYMLKLIHLIDDKIHSRSTGPYSLVTQQPLRGRAKQGGQRFGEMEVWALEAYGAAYTLIELLTLKADDIDGRNLLFSSIINNEALPNPKIPEAFKILIFELKSIGLEIKANKIFIK